MAWTEKDRPWLAAYWLAAFCLAWLVFDRAAFGLIDDYFFFEESLVHGHWKMLWGDPSGRFYPLCGKEFFILREFGILSAPLFYSIQALKVLAGAYFALGILRRAGASPRMAFVVALFVFGSPAYMVAVSRLFVAELTPFTLFLAALCFLPDRERGPAWRFPLALACATIALFHKEPGFLAVGTMGAVLFLMPRRSAPPDRFMGTCLMASATFFFLSYMAFGYSYMTENDYTVGRTLGMAVTAEFFARNDAPLVAMFIICLTHWFRLLKARTIAPFETACLAASLVYAGAYLGLRITSPWYLLPAYAFILPVLPPALAWTSEILPRGGNAFRIVLFPGCLLAGCLWAIAGYGFLDFNKAAAKGAEQFLNYLSANRPEPGQPAAPLVFPRESGEAEVSQSLRVLLMARGLDKAFSPVFSGLYDIWRTLDARPGLAVLTPYTHTNLEEIHQLASCRASLLDTGAPAAFPNALASLLGLSAPDGTSRKTLMSTGAFRVFAQAPASPQSSGTTPCPRGFEWSFLQATTPVRGVKVCPLTGGSLPMRLTNASAESFILNQSDPAGIVRIVLFTALPGESPRPIGSHPLPERLAPGESVDIRLDFSIFTRQPGIISVALGMADGQDVRFVLDRPLFTSNFLPRFAQCWAPQEDLLKGTP
ncbi:MAG: hypothetical protein HY795_12535 [Desulfovibrio sp.]|nr:hypothetical protein [Desulfovibrio sp.]MBI4960293.1 hypothetical protein [Desulfovibrio sp.]